MDSPIEEPAFDGSNLGDREIYLLQRQASLTARIRRLLDYCEREKISLPREIVLDLKGVVAAPTDVKKFSFDTGADFGALVASMGRFMNGCANMDLFGDSRLGLAEWVALTVLQSQGPISDRNLCRYLGLSWKRAQVVIATLTKENYAKATPPGKPSQQPEVSITKKGIEKMNITNALVAERASRTLGRNPLMFQTILKTMRVLTRFPANIDAPNEELNPGGAGESFEVLEE